MATIAQLGERALRRLGVQVVAVADRPGNSSTVAPTAIATRALQALGIVAQPTGSTTTVSVAIIAARVLQGLGVIVPQADRPAAAAVEPANDIATAALVKLGVVSGEETPTAADLALANDRLVAVHDYLVQQGLAAWLIGAIPQAVAEEYTIILTVHLASSFGRQPDKEVQDKAEGRIRRYNAVVRGQALTEAKVAAVHDALVRQGAVSWAVSAIPQAVAEDYVAITAIHMAPVFGATADPAGIPALEARAKRVELVQRAPAFAAERVASIHAWLVDQGTVTWDVSAIPSAIAEEYAALTAAHLAPVFGQPGDMKAVAAMEERVRKRALVLQGPALATEKVMAVHSSLGARGRLRWTAFDIPDYAEEIYIILAANHLAPAFGLPIDQASGQWAARELSAVISLPTSGERTPAEYF